jgi:hypothetical protein
MHERPGLRNMVARIETNVMHNSDQSRGPAALGPGASEEGLGHRSGAKRRAAHGHNWERRTQPEASPSH